MSQPETPGHELQDLIGHGSVGAVYRAMGTNGKPCAVKVFGAMSINRKGLSNTLRLLQAMPAHRGVLPVLAFDMDRSPYHLTMPLIGGASTDAQGSKAWQTTTAESLCGKLKPDDAWNYIYEIADSMAWLHKHSVAHGNLKCGNVLITNDPEGSTRVADMGQGYVGGVHHMEVNDHFMHLCPEQIEMPDGFYSAAGMSWDAYSFGVVSYRLLTGRFPRGEQAWINECAIRQQKTAQGLAYGVNSGAILEAVRAHGPITWPDKPQTKWEERRRTIIEKALSLDFATRWKDVREIAREFELLEADYALEESRAQTIAERDKQAGKIRKLHALWFLLAGALTVAVIYGVRTTANYFSAERQKAEAAEAAKKEIVQRDQKIGTLATELTQTQENKEASDENLRRSQKMVDQLVTQLVQLPTENNLQVAFSNQQLDDAAGFIKSSLPALEANAAMAPERARAYGNLGMIAVRQRNTSEAVKYLDKARNDLHALITRDPNSEHTSLYRQWLGRFGLQLAKMRVARGDGDNALPLFKESVDHLDPGLQANPKDRNARYEAAQAWFEYGARCRLEGKSEESATAFQKVTTALDEKAIGEPLMTEERFLLARGELERGLALRDVGKVSESVDTLVAGVQNMATLVAASSPQNKDQAVILATAFTELAEIVARHYSPKEASEAHYEALKILFELNRVDPDWKEVKYLIARNNGEIAALERDMGKASEALRLKRDAIEVMNEVVSNDSENRTYLYHQAKLRGELAELVAENGDAKKALPGAQQAIENLQNLLQQLPNEKPTAQRREWEIQLAILHGIHGQVNEAAKLRTAARAAYTAAQKQWDKIAAANPGNETVKQGQAWVKNKLAKVK